MNAQWLAEHLREAEQLVDSATTDGVPTYEFIERRLSEAKVRGGRRRHVPVRTLFVALQLAAFAGQYFLSELPDLLAPLSPATRRRLGLASQGEPMTYRQVCYLVSRIDQVLRNDFLVENGRTVGGYDAFDGVFSAIATTGSSQGAGRPVSIAVDGSDIPTWGTSSTQFEAKMEPNEDGELKVARDANDDALYEKVRVITDPDAGWRGSRNPEGKVPHFGYALTVAVSVREEGGPEVPRAALAARFRPTNVQDRQMGLDCVQEVARRCGGLNDVLADRGYTSSKDGKDFVLPVREMGGEPIFSLTEHQQGPEGTLRGAVIIEGRPYSPSIPRRLLTIRPPKGGVEGTYKPNPVKLREYQELIAAREVYALLPHGARRPNLAQVFQCPGAAGKLECPLQRARRGLRPGALPVLNAPSHPGPDSVCVNAYPTFSAEELPLFQRHVFGSRAWFDSYKRRSTSVEPFFGALKDAAGGGVVRGRIRVMGIIKTGLLVAFALASTNRRLARAFTVSTRPAEVVRRRRGRPTRRRPFTYRHVIEEVATTTSVRQT